MQKAIPFHVEVENKDYVRRVTDKAAAGGRKWVQVYFGDFTESDIEELETLAENNGVLSAEYDSFLEMVEFTFDASEYNA
jgi:hypothetical protein